MSIQQSLQLLFLFSSLLSLSFGAVGTPIKAVNLGGWLVTEGWIKPSLFDGIPNKDLLDGTQVQLKSVAQGKFLSALNGGGTIIVANRTKPSDSESFSLWRINESTFQMRVANGLFVGVEDGGVGLVAVCEAPGRQETFDIVRKAGDPKRIRLKAANGMFVQVKAELTVTADFAGNTTSWSENDPSVYEMSIASTMRGEFQITNGYGKEKATRVMREHWKNYITEKDFQFIADNGLNAVRIPIGWWIASDPTPPWPFVGGSLTALDNAFLWSERYNVKVIIDLHAAPASQNGWEHSGSRDRFIDWGKTDENINQTLQVIDFLTARYAKSQSLLAVELMNEPLSPEVPLKPLTRYYETGYDVVRRHSSEAYVIMSNRLGRAEPTELLHLSSGRSKIVIDVHFYLLFSNFFDNTTVQDNINIIERNVSSALNSIIRSNGPQIFVGEWVAEWQVKAASKEDYRRFAQAQLKAYGLAAFGWAYWTLKNVNRHWSLEWMITNGYITL